MMLNILKIFVIADEVAIALCLCGIAWCCFMLIRNRWVYLARMGLLHRDFTRFKTLSSYDHMMKRWWAWDLEEFLPGGKHYRRDA